MKLYHSAMEHCVPPEGLEERLRQRVLSAAPQTQRKHVFRPRGYVRKAVLAAVLAIILTVSAGAAPTTAPHSRRLAISPGWYTSATWPVARPIWLP